MWQQTKIGCCWLCCRAGGCLGSKRHCVLCSLHVGLQSQQWLPRQRPPRSEPPSNTSSSPARAPGPPPQPDSARDAEMWPDVVCVHKRVCDLLVLVHFVCIMIFGGCLSTAELCTLHGCLLMIPMFFTCHVHWLQVDNMSLHQLHQDHVTYHIYTVYSMYSIQGCVKLYGRTALETLVDSGGWPCWKPPWWIKHDEVHFNTFQKTTDQNSWWRKQLQSSLWRDRAGSNKKWAYVL